ncbi:tRNA (adenosine(37)-N6)-dimethylallyltransferase MiaA [Sanyastnella coralliicola]|uniref:tRNA (adenosine(37)-N6)-dimethylallyltransferase MiaA n=1 Tax=Sanyastnella coralliicola TaxID=3069118 RepID=UPI0027BB08BB|nr:tRNA (adenosine(37)-N6)-dimethylallyltransferase MiaA [Longitalea sp. SCSIO 12813]
MSRPLLIVLAGPTAIGKTAAAIRLAQHFDAEIVSADSRQFYKELSIGTAKQTPEERAQAVHHFVDFLSIEDEYSAGDFERDVIEFLDQYFKEKSVAILTGGSGLYIKAITKGFDELPSDLLIRASLIKKFEEKGIEPLQEELKALDPEHYAAMDIHNPQRLMRALEVCKASGQKYSDLRLTAGKERAFDVLYVGLTAEREVIYDRINQRVDLMMEAGLEAEAKAVFPQRDRNALNTVGYKELFQYFDGELDKETAVEKIKQHTRNFAKRQMTWFRKNTDIQWFDFRASEEMISWIEDAITKRQEA